jgi:hypothetical protein
LIYIIILSSLLISSKCFSYTNNEKYIEAQNKAAEALYKSTGLESNINKYGKSLEDSVDKEYRPILGWTFKALESIVKGRIEYKVRFP